jgi:hypothetical protein
MECSGYSFVECSGYSFVDSYGSCVDWIASDYE